MAATLRLGRPRPLGAFYRKEFLDVVRQPWLLVVMVLGPFLVLAAFAFGYSEDVRPYRTVFVGDPAGPIATRLDESAADLQEFMDYRGVTRDEGAARTELAEGHVDAVVVLPDDPLAQVLAGEQATLTVIHRRLDPIEQTAIQFASRIAVEEINAQVLAGFVTEGQEEVASLSGLIEQARSALDQLLAAVDAQDAARADEVANDVSETLTQVDVVAGIIERIADEAGDSGSSVAEASAAIADLAGRARGSVSDVQGALSGSPVTDARALVAEVDSRLDEMVPVAEQLLDVQAEVLVRPFASDVALDVEGNTALADYYAPAAVVLLLQQFGVAFAALSFVRERELGIVELYRVSPMGSLSMLAGKYGAYLTLGGVVAAGLLGLVVATTGVPFRGAVIDAAVVLVLVLLASIGIGFLISLWSKTDIQAVLPTMLVLLASLFFSGFFLRVDAIDWPIRAVAYVLPATYGIEALRDVQLQGTSPDTTAMTVLGVYAAALAIVVLAGTKRSMASR